MRTSPLRALIATPFTSMLTSSSPMLTSGCPRLGRDHASAAVLDHVLKLVTEVLEEALHGPGGGIPQATDGVAFDTIGDVEQQIQILHARLAGQDALQRAIQPTRALAAGRALATGFGHVEAREPLQGAHHAGG